MQPIPPDSWAATTRMLPEPDQRLLARAPLETVVLDVRFLAAAESFSPEAGLRLKKSIEDTGQPVERLEQIQQHAMQVQFGLNQPPNPIMSTQGIGWRLVPPDASWVATVVPGQASLQSTSYEKWETSFRPLLAALLHATSDVADPSLCQRVGLRYIDRFVEEGARTPGDWAERINPAMLGPLSHEVLAPLVISSQQQVELSLGGARNATLRHGPFQDGAIRGAVSYLLDIDVFDTTSSAFDADHTLATADELNRDALSLFQACVCPGYLDELRGTP